MDLLDILKEEHESIWGLMREIERTEGPDARGQLFDQLRDILSEHCRLEDQLFYSTMVEWAEVRIGTMSAREEHGIIRRLLDDMSSAGIENERWPAKFAVLAETLRQHMRQEERSLFKHARRLLDSERLESLGEAALLQKEKLAIH
ncbi:MAG: hemerythrin domain-containing protein [Elusimicrobia bacterium]|nr:hemerythrin domain-containing protein [Elusimicrobiota bacterium]